jgi:Uma2 family endonuclease
MEIVLPETKPATEWVRGRALQKVSPQERHARAQFHIVSLVGLWAEQTGAGRVGTEWEFRIGPPGEDLRPLVPDVAFLSYERIGYDDDEAAQIPRVAPDVAFEVVSPRDRKVDIEHKIGVYLASGTRAVVLVDPARQTATVHDISGVARLASSDVFSHEALPGFAVQVARFFEKAIPPERRV